MHDFTDAGILAKMDQLWTGSVFQSIILDYFYTPNSWHEQHFSETMYTHILPILASKSAIPLGGEVWLPYIPCIEERIHRLWEHLQPWFSNHSISDPNLNQLYAASAVVEQDILASGDRFTNGSALISLNRDSPFIMLKCTRSGDRLAPDQRVGCGSLVTDLRPTGQRQLRFKLPANSKLLTTATASSVRDNAPLPPPAPSTASHEAPSPALSGSQTSLPTLTGYPTHPRYRKVNVPDAPSPDQPPLGSSAPTGPPPGPPTPPTPLHHSDVIHSTDPSSAPPGPPPGSPTSPSPHSHPPLDHSHPEGVSINTGTRAATREHNYRIGNTNSILGRWLASIKDPLHCPPILQGGQYLKGSPASAIDEFIECL